MSARVMPLTIAAAAIAVAVVVVVLVLGAGASAAPGQTVAVVPPTAALYVELLTHPGGAQGATAERVLAPVLGDAPLERLGPLLARALAPGGDLQYDRDVRPWLGERVGAFQLALSGPGARPAVLAASRDDSVALALIARLGGTPVRYRSVSYTLRADGDAVALVDHVVVSGPQAAVRASIDATRDGSLGDTDAYRFEVGALSGSRIGLAYLDVTGAAAAIPARVLPAPLRAALVGRLAGAATSPLVGAFSAAPGAIVLDIESDAAQLSVAAAPPPVAGGGGGQPSGSPSAAPSVQSATLPVVSQLPSDALFGLALDTSGAALSTALDPTTQPPDIAVEIASLRRRLGALLGLDPVRNLFPWMGDAALMVRPRAHHGLDVAFVVNSLDPAGTARSAALIEAALARRRGLRILASPIAGPGFAVAGVLPRPLLILPRRERLVVATSTAIALDVLTGPRRLSERPDYALGVTADGPDVTPTAFVDGAQLARRARGALAALLGHVSAAVIAGKARHVRIAFVVR